jgi:hypothetical protein
MKSILSLILPDNRGTNISRRYLKNGRKAIGFQDRQLVVASPSGVENGIQAITADDLQEFTGTSATVVRRVNRFSGQAGSAVTATIPAPSGELRELIIMNANSNAGSAVTLSGGGTIIGALASPGVVANNVSAHLLSNGTSWYRIV